MSLDCCLIARGHGVGGGFEDDGEMKRSGVLIATVALVAALVASVPALAFSGHAYHDGTSRSGGRPSYAGGSGYDHYAYGPNCLRYGYPPTNNCAYWELPDWNGGIEIRNPGGG